MRIKEIYISEYKNLKDFTLNFDGDSFIDVFVGKNGTGKSNLFEAILEIFKHLFEDGYEVAFDYKLKYELEGNEIAVSWNWTENKWLDEKGVETKKVSEKQLPDNILIYYSGHNNKITELVDQYETKFKKGLKEANVGDTRKFIGIGKDYKAILLSVLLLQKDDCKAKKFIVEKLGVKSIAKEIKITLKRPYYAKTKGYEIDNFIPETRYWKAQGITLDFLDKLSTVKSENTNGRARDEGYLRSNDDDYADKYILYLDIEDFQNKFLAEAPQDIFKSFDNLKTIEMLEDLSIDVELLDDTTISIDKFSDGQFQSVYIYSIIELFKDRNCITLLDEPDAFLHPEWQFSFLKQVFEITNEAAVNNHVLMSSHSASTISASKEKTINLFEINGNTIKVVKYPKSDVIKSLSSGLITFSESEAKLNINHFLNNTSGAVLFTEGITDEMILETAWNKLYPDEKPNFEIQNAYSCGFLRNTLKDQTLYTRYPNKIFFSVFDFDEAYNDWNQLGADIEANPTKCLTKQLKTFESYSMLLPVTNAAISNQVINPTTGRTYGNRSLLTIELMFYNVPTTEAYFIVDTERTDGFIKFISDAQKVKFAEEVIPNIDAQYFEVFRPIFEFINDKLKAKVEKAIKILEE